MLAEIQFLQEVGRFLDTLVFATMGVWAVYFHPKKIDRELADPDMSFETARTKRAHQSQYRTFGLVLLGIAVMRFIFVL